MKRILFALTALILSTHANAQTPTYGRATTAAPTYLNATLNPISLDLSGNLRTVTTLGPSSSVIGHVITDTGSTTAVTALPTIPAGTNLIGKVGIDQTTPGITNGVQVNAALPAGANVIGALTANQSVNEAQINGVAPLMGNGASGTGTQRTNLANDNTAIANWGQGATGASVPTGAQQTGNNVAGNLTGQIGCGSSVIYDAATNGSTQLVAISASTSIYVCGYTIIASGTVNVELDYGTGAACVTSPTKIVPAYQLTAQAGVSDTSPIFRGLKTTAGQALCLKTSAGVNVQAIVYYTQF